MRARFCRRRLRYHRGAGVSDDQPDHFRGRAAEEAELTEVVVLGHEDEPVLRRVAPHDGIRLAVQPDAIHVCGVRERRRQSRS